MKIDGPVHNPPRFTFWFGPFAECSSVLDIDADGKLATHANMTHIANRAVAVEVGGAEPAASFGNCGTDDSSTLACETSGACH